MINLESLSHEHKERLAEDCEDYLNHRYIPLKSYAYDNIIVQAIREGYVLPKFGFEMKGNEVNATNK